MFETKRSLSGQLADAADLMIDFATLGEYGLEPADRTVPSCEGRRHGRPRLSTGAWHSAIDRFATHP